MRTINATLQAALDAGTFKPYIKAIVRRGAVTNTYDVMKYRLTATSLEIKTIGLVTVTTQASPTTIELKRGATVNGVDYTISTSKFIVTSGKNQKAKDGQSYTAEIQAELIHPIYMTFLADGSYENAIDSFCTALGKTYTLKNPSATFWTDQFLPAGRNFTTNNAQSFLTLLRQKRLIFACDNGGEDILFYSAVDNAHTADYELVPTGFYYLETGILPSRRYMARDESASLRFSGTAGDILHNLGYIHSTDSLPTVYSQEQNLTPYAWSLQLYMQSGDKIDWDQSQTILYPADIAEIFNPELGNIPWRIEISQQPMFSNTEGGALPSTIEAAAPYTPLNTGQFSGILSSSDNNIQAAMETIDDHTHSGLVTNGNSHDHNGGDGAQIAHANLSGLTSAGAHPASAISVADAGGLITATEVEAALQEIFAKKYAVPMPANAQNGTLGAGVTNTLPFYSLALNASAVNMLLTRAGKIKNLYLRLANSQPATGSLVATLYVNNVASSLVLTIAAGSGAATYSETSTEVTVSAGDLVRVDIKNNATGTSAAIGAMVADFITSLF